MTSHYMICTFSRVLKMLNWYFQTSGAIKYIRETPDKAREMFPALLLESELKKMPPSLVVTCGFDPLRDEGIAHVERLRAAGTNVKHKHYSGQLHGFVFDWAHQNEESEAARNAISEAIKTRMSEVDLADFL